jgi:hypothetical protein
VQTEEGAREISETEFYRMQKYYKRNPQEKFCTKCGEKISRTLQYVISHYKSRHGLIFTQKKEIEPISAEKANGEMVVKMDKEYNYRCAICDFYTNK